MSTESPSNWRPSYPWAKSSGDSGDKRPARTQNAWGRAWRNHIQKLGDYADRLSEGQSDLRHGAVRHLQIRPGSIRAEVRGTVLYRQTIHIPILSEARKDQLTSKLAGSAENALDLMEGRLPDPVMDELTDPKTGLFPESGELELECTCLPRPGLCKHLAAVLHEIGSRLDETPDLLFLLRGVDPEALIAEVPALFVSRPPPEERQLGKDMNLSELFGIEITTELPPIELPTQSPDEPAFQNALLADFDDDDDFDDFDDFDDDDDDEELSSKSAADAKDSSAAKPSPFEDEASEEEEYDDEDDDEEEPFTLSRQQLLEIGIPSSRIQKWLKDEWLVRTEERGVYEVTPDAWDEIEPLLD